MRRLLALLLTIVGLAPADARAAEVSPVGEWRWFNKVIVTIKTDGTVSESKGHRGIWKWIDSDSRELMIIWERTTDTLKLSADGTYLQGRSSDHGIGVSGERIDRLAPLRNPSTALMDSAPTPGEFVGRWNIFYDNGHVRTYSISAAGTVTWTHTHGRAGPNKKAKIERRGKDYLIDFGDDDKVERLSVIPGGLRIEHFVPRSNYRDGGSFIPGTGRKR